MNAANSTDKAAAGLRFFQWVNLAETRQFHHDVQPERPVPRFSINGVPVCTPGNLTAITAPSKAGKSSAIGAMKAAVIAADAGNNDCDLLGFSAAPPEGKKIIHIDTEQSFFDADVHVRKSGIRAGVEPVPDWCTSYGLAGSQASDLVEMLRALLWYASLGKGTYAVILDGVADFVADVNDAKECNALVTELHALAIQYDCVIICVIHFNPGSEKSRGHLGSQLERKAESNLVLEKDEAGVVTLYATKQRGAPISKKDGPRFAWSLQDDMHVSVESKASVKDAEKLSDLRDLAEDVFADGTLRYADACQKIETARRVGAKASEKWFTAMKKAKIITKVELGFWRFTPPDPTTL